VTTRAPFVHAATLTAGNHADPDALGGAVTEALCGRSDHEGPCRWPHNNAVASGAGSTQIRIVFIAHESDEAEVRGRIETALRNVDGWTLAASGVTSLVASEHAQAKRLARTPAQPAE
jgi:hypothetical protein